MQIVEDLKTIEKLSNKIEQNKMKSGQFIKSGWLKFVFNLLRNAIPSLINIPTF